MPLQLKASWRGRTAACYRRLAASAFAKSGTTAPGRAVKRAGQCCACGELRRETSICAEGWLSCFLLCILCSRGVVALSCGGRARGLRAALRRSIL